MSDAVVYDTQARHFDVPSVSGYRENYLCGKAWMELYFRVKVGGYPRDYVAVIRATRVGCLNTGRKVNKVDANGDGQQLEKSMLVQVTQFV